VIPLSIPEEKRATYQTWLEDNREELEAGFAKYLAAKAEKKKADWISSKHRGVIRSFLAPASHEKCAFCERKPNLGGGYLQIEHFLPKDHHHDLVFELTNLLPACEQCNTVKGARCPFGGSAS